MSLLEDVVQTAKPPAPRNELLLRKLLIIDLVPFYRFEHRRMERSPLCRHFFHVTAIPGFHRLTCTDRLLS